MRRWQVLAGALVVAGLVGAAYWFGSDGVEEADEERNGEVVAPAPPGSPVPAVETPPADGDADDPAVWVHPDDPSASVVIGTDKDHGLGVYDLSGRLLQFVAEGEPNNVDVRDGFPLRGETVPLVVAADDSDAGGLRVYRLDPASRRLVGVAAHGVAITTGIEAHGLCLYRSPRTGKFYAFPNDQDGRVEQWELADDGTGRVAGHRVRAFTAGDGAVEGCVADDTAGVVFVGEEEGGVWRFGAEPDDPVDAPLEVDRIGGAGGLTPDVEGLAILETGGGEGFLVVSSQGDNAFAVYRRRAPHEFVARFRIGAGAGGVDGCEDTDGIEVVARELGPAFPGGLFVCQDGKNGEEESNFKFVPLPAVLAEIGR